MKRDPESLRQDHDGGTWPESPAPTPAADRPTHGRFRAPRLTRQDLDQFGPIDTSPESPNELGLVMTGGGARGAYQVGTLRALARHIPDLRVPIITGVSAGAVNAVHMAAHHGTFEQAVEELTGLWQELTPERVFRSDIPHLGWSSFRTTTRTWTRSRRSTWRCSSGSRRWAFSSRIRRRRSTCRRRPPSRSPVRR